MRRFVFVTALVALAPTLAIAHPGHGGGWMNGFAHPFSGLDHLLAMIAVGLWAARQAGPRALAMPLAFMGAMIVGGVAGAFGVTVPFIEPLILGSAIVVGLCALSGSRSLFAPGLALIAFAGAVHGYAHGQEMPAAASLLTYGAGFLAGTAMLHAMGFILGRALVSRTRTA